MANSMTASRLRMLLGPLLMPIVGWSLVLAVQGRGIPDPRWRLDDLTVVETDPPGQRPSAYKDGLTWQSDAGSTEFTLRHTFVHPAGDSPEPLALYVPSVERNVELFLNGTKLGDGGPMTPVPARNRHRPLLFTVPQGLLRPGANALDLRVVGEREGNAFLQPVYLGPRAPLEPAYRWQYAFKVTSLQVIVASLLLVMLFIAALWMRRPRETAYGWFSAGLFFWCVSNVFYLVTLPGTGWYVLNHAATALYICCMILFVHRLGGLRSRAIERIVFGLTTATSLAALLAYTLGLWPLLSAGWVILQVLGVYQLVRLFVLCFTQRTSAIYWLASGSVLAISFGVHDFLHLYGILDPAVPNLSQYGALLALLVFGSILVGRFADALRESEELNVSLDAKVQQKTAALEAQFDRTRTLERQMVLAQERERLVRDMHDGMGGQLISLLTLVRSGQRDPQVLEEAIAECIQDLRLMIDSMDTAGEDLAVGLGMLRARLEPRLRAMGLEVHWDTHQLPEGLRLGPEGVLQVFRILQEALQNAIKHAGARGLWIEARVDGAPNVIVLSARDDGVGMPERPAEGRGLGNMRRRAQQIGATLAVEPAHPGTRVSLSLPPIS